MKKGLLADSPIKKQLAEYGQRGSDINFRILAETIPHFVWSARADGVSDYYNARFLKYLGRSLEEMQGWTWAETLHPDDRQAGIDAWNEAFSKGAEYCVEYRIRRADGHYLWHEGRATPLRDAAGNIVRWFGTCTDIDERKRIEVELVSAKDAAEASSRAKSEFFANMSHEIRTPLTAITTATQLIQSHDVSEELKQYLDIILTSSEGLLAIIDDILDLSKIEADKVELVREMFSLRESIWDVVKMHMPIAHTKGLTIKTNIPSVVPDDFAGDKLRLKQILLNLVGNAVKFTDRGGITISVTMLERRDDKALLRFDVTDTGIGIKQESIEKIFAPFSQEDGSSTRKFGGTGLGLAICMRLVNLMGGKIWVESTKGKGSTFHVQIPFVVADSPI